MKKEKICAYCGEPFIPNSNQQIYCKRPHYMKCPVCGKDYLVTNNEKLKFPPVACSYACRQAKARQTNLEKYGVESYTSSPEMQNKSKETMLKKYGVEYALASKEIQEKSKQTLLEKYGVDNAMKSEKIRQKAEETNIEKYGSKTFLTSEEGKRIYKEQLWQKYNTDHPFHSEQIRQKWIQGNLEKYGTRYFTESTQGKQKIQQTIRDKYGVSSVTQLDEIKQKMRETFLKHYGVDNPSKNKNIKKKIKQVMINKYGADNCMAVPSIREKIIKTNMEKFGVPFSVMAEHVRNKGGVISKINKDFTEELKRHDIKCVAEFRVNKKGYDVMIPQLNLLVELNPTYTHNTIGNHWNKQGLKLNYHADKVKIAQDVGCDIRCVFDWDSTTELIQEITETVNATTVSASSIYILNKKVGRDFLKKYGRNRLSQYPKKTMIFGTIDDKGVVQAIAIGLNLNSSAFSQSNYRILNYGTRWNANVKEGFNSILKFINEFIPLDDICGYVDADRFNLRDIQDLNININSIQRTEPIMYWSKKTIRIPTRAKCNNIQFLEEGWLPVEDCGQIGFTLNKLT